MDLKRWAKKTVTYLGVVLATNAVGAHMGVDDLGDVAPNPNEVHIKSIAYAGSGCPAGTVSESMAPDAKAFTLLFDSYVAEAGVGIPLSAQRKNCQVAIDLRFPSGWSYTIFEVDYRGYGNLERGVTGLQKTNYYFQGQKVGPALQTNFRGPMDDDYHIRDTLGLDAVVWSPCGVSRALNLNTQVRLTAPRGKEGILTVDSIDGELSHIYGIKWRRCR